MECLAALAPAVATAIVRHPLTCASNKRKNGWCKAKLNDDQDDPLLQAAINRASLRFRETRRPDPLFIDQYAGCFGPHNTPMDIERYPHHYCLATKFIDDKLLTMMNDVDGLKQVVLLTDGMDTRPYRLSWPTSTIMFDVSPAKVFTEAAHKLEDVGAKIPKSCLFLHVPLESSDIQQSLRSKGFNGNRPSIWALQGLPLMTLTCFEDILSVASSLAMKGCVFFGELPAWLAETEIGIKSCKQSWMDKLFMGNGFRVSLISYNELAKNVGREQAPGDCETILFVAEQLRFSDDEMETWRREFQRIEEAGDEEGFEEL
ncbi:S-adenosyl-L-methionine-dependent methyltransferase [Actinidia chinensis var. chinensis]|uniref:S-adenosyl-L-methionine-dependent methyltransferase n=1 Tax=Actinidia chinensis var. chinensis TaxID=1590841 RepID=A0A2R6PDP0_ACTCC|nr:S-adenosyl-L-methionine-dependent methyltransferase [Actinidia chinensis var. chinensis]